MEQILPRSPQKEPTWPTLCFQTFSLQNHERINFWCFQPPSLCTSSQMPSKPIHPGLEHHMGLDWHSLKSFPTAHFCYADLDHIPTFSPERKSSLKSNLLQISRPWKPGRGAKILPTWDQQIHDEKGDLDSASGSREKLRPSRSLTGWRSEPSTGSVYMLANTYTRPHTRPHTSVCIHTHVCR